MRNDERIGATIHDVAREAGVSTATVSRVINDHPVVSEETRRRVRSAIESLSYNPNQAARSLKTRVSKTVGVIVPELASDFFMLLVETMEHKLAARGYSLLVCSSYENVEEEKRRLTLLMEKLADAIVMIPATDRGGHLHAVQSRGIPLVFIDRIATGCRPDAVLVDNEKGAFEATSALIADGYRRVGFIGGDLHVSTMRERYEGYRRAMKKAGLKMEKEFVRLGPPHVEWGYRAMREMSELPDRPEAFFIVNLYTHIGATDYLMSRGGRVGGGVEPLDGRRSVRNAGSPRPRGGVEPRPRGGVVFAAFDEMHYSPLLRFCRYAVAQPIAEMGAAAARLVLERIEGRRRGEPVVQRLPTKLIRH
jgi:LacI family transcriptional regulator